MIQPIVLDHHLIRDEIIDRLDDNVDNLTSSQRYAYQKILDECDKQELMIALDNAINNHYFFFDALDEVISNAIDQLSTSID